MSINYKTDKNHKINRSELAKILAKANKEERAALLETMKTNENDEYWYKASLQQHQWEKEELKKTKNEASIWDEEGENNNRSFAQFYDGFFEYEDGELATTEMEERKKEYFQIPLNIWKEKLAQKTLIDLWCWHRRSRQYMYKLAARSWAKEYIWVDKYQYKGNDDFSKYQKDEEKEIKNFPKAEVINEDMLIFLCKRTAPSNFVINWIDFTILEDSNYIKELIKNIDRLTLPWNIVFGIGCGFLYKLEKYWFKLINKNEFTALGIEIREKIVPESSN